MSWKCVPVPPRACRQRPSLALLGAQSRNVAVLQSAEAPLQLRHDLVGGAAQG